MSRTFHPTLPAAALLAALAVHPALAQQTLLAQAARADTSQTRPAAPAAGRVLRAAPAQDVRIDGRLDEAAWASAPAATEFVQQRPSAGAAATERTEARVLFDGEALYVGMRMYDAHPDSILAQLTRRDQGSTSDGARVFIDSYHDRRTAFVFGLNPRGVKDDFLRFDDASGIDYGWDAVWDGAASVDSLGWTAEFRIPLSQIRFDASRVNGGGRWGLNFRREIARKAETVFWSPIPPNSEGFVSLFGELEGLSNLRQGRRLEILPYTSARVTHAPGSRANPYWSPNDLVGSVGADLKAGLPGGLTLSATINPDFGQVEVDPAVVNLSAFETFFPEQRPFFVEGADIFRFGNLQSFNTAYGSTFFYSRRVGRSPQGFVDVDGVSYDDVPEASTILGAAKVSGKTGPWSVGVMNAVTARETAPFVTEDGTRGEYPVEPLTNYFVGRVRRDFRQGRSVLGALVTGVNRDLRGNEMDGLLRARGYVAGVDGLHTWGNRAWSVSGFAARSVVAGSEDAIARTQRSSARYFQRPDADHLRYETDRTTLGGHDLGVALRHGGSWDLSLSYQETSPGFETNDIGFQSRADVRSFSTFFGQRINKQRGILRSHSYHLYTNHSWNFGGDQILAGLGSGFNTEFTNLWYGGMSFNINPEYTNDRLTRGGPLATVPSQWEVSGYMGTDSRKPVSLELSAGYREDASGEYDRSVSLGASFRPTSSVQVSLSPRFAKERDTDQYVASGADEAATATFGQRYLLANLDQTTVSMDTRVNWTFSPTLSLQVFAQPFIAVGDFWGYKTLDRPRSFSFTPIAGNPSGEAPFTYDPDGAAGPAEAIDVSDGSQLDFTVLSLRGNAVLRWEYRPGSALFLVWQQDRYGETADGTFRFGDNAREIFDRQARNVFLIKATYWLNR